MVEVSVFFCITMWLPRCLTSVNPCFSRIPQTPLPERILSLPNSYLKPGDEYLAMRPFANLLRRSRFEEKLQGFLQIREGFFFRLALACDIHFQTLRDEPVALPPDRSSKWALHAAILAQVALPMGTIRELPWPVFAYTGILPCFFRGSSSCFCKLNSSARMSVGRISCGSMISSTCCKAAE